ncbi:inositol 2-dehydrogenase [Paenibacillus marchantiophytorum]|uniref:Inositol 2-dehydrogenase n=1 Tax=Paenibacillus marchantiophytorum TaxID=1619310 RepID=A0ABQ2BPZ5_9BACL|nr:Gfo/Idh/MocA family oxidoreductase [Paenibacillus marchantiophytorum]GGI44875.1 inositol 2-dehydrogenase [Paenibacillus marchantiophytorum]
MIQAAIIGAGCVGQRYAKHLLKTELSEIVGVYDADVEAASQLGMASNCQSFTKFEALTAAIPANTVFVCMESAIGSRKQHILLALLHGRHVITPLTAELSLTDIKILMEASYKYNTRLLFLHPEKFTAHNRDIQKNIDDGAIGQIGMINVKRYSMKPLFSAWHDLAILDIDLLRWIVGDVATVYAMRTSSENVDYTLITLKFTNGAIANIEDFLGYPGEYTSAVEYAGSKGVIRYDSRKTNALYVHKTAVPASQPAKTGFCPSFRDPEYEELVYLLNCFQDNHFSVSTVEDAFETRKVIAAVAQSIKTGKPVRPADAIWKDDLYANAEDGGQQHA